MVYLETIMHHLMHILNEKQLAKQSLQQQQRICAVVAEMQEELAIVFSNSHLPKIVSINNPMQIRFANCKINAGAVLYQFTIDKTNYENLPFVICDTIRKDMNLDIAHFQQQLLQFFTDDQLQLLYPLLYHGIYVLAITDAPTAIVLTVSTNYAL